MNAQAKSKGGRPPAAVRVMTDFRTRTTEGERDAIDALVEMWRQERAEKTGDPPSPSDGVTLWFRSLIQREAALKGITIKDGPPPAPKAKRSKKS